MNTPRHSRDLYRGQDPRTLPAYDARTITRYLGIPQATLHHWTHGYGLASGRRQLPIITLDDPDGRFFSFANLIELHVLNALRNEHQVRLPSIRSAVTYLQAELKSKRPLLEQALETDGANIFVEHLGQLLNASKHGQTAMPELLRSYLRRIERDAHGWPVRLFPFTRVRAKSSDPRLIAMDPSVAFGKPVITGSRVPTREVFERYRLGESVSELADDFGRQVAEIEEALRIETGLAA